MSGPDATPELTTEAFMAASATVPDHVVFREFDGETVVLNLQSGTYHGTNAAGGRLLALLREGDGAVAPAVERLADEYGERPDAIVPGLTRFACELTIRGLIELDAGAG